MITIIYGLFGIAVGSFLNVCIDRLPHGESIITPPSHCPSCNRRVGIIDLVPVFSYIWLRGRCRYCQAHIPLRLPIVEGITGLLFFIIYWQFNYELSMSFAITLVYSCILITIFFIDLEHQLILNSITYPAMIIALGFCPCSSLWSSSNA